MNDSALPADGTTYLEALITASDDDVIVWGRNLTTVSVMRCVRNPRYALMARRHAQGTEVVQVLPNNFIYGNLICACCLEPLGDHRYAPRQK